MNDVRRLAATCLMFVSFVAQAAEEPKAPPVAANPPNPATSAVQATPSTKSTGATSINPIDFKGDELTFKLPASATLADLLAKAAGTTICIPPGKVLTGIDPVTVKSQSGPSATGPTFTLLGRPGVADADGTCPALSGNTAHVVIVDLDTINQVPHFREGLNTGVLAVPFKFHIHDRKFTSSVSVAMYTGWRREITGLGTNDSLLNRSFCYFTASCSSLDGQLIAFLGASLTSLATSSTSSDGKSSTSTQSFGGYSYGFGYLGNIKSDVSIGAVIGWDRVSSGDNYPYNHRPWISLEIGKSFGQ